MRAFFFLTFANKKEYNSMAKLRIAFSGIGAVGGYYGGMVAARYQGTIKADIFFYRPWRKSKGYP